jgi:hypothetical protein
LWLARSAALAKFQVAFQGHGVVDSESSSARTKKLKQARKRTTPPPRPNPVPKPIEFGTVLAHFFAKLPTQESDATPLAADFAGNEVAASAWFVALQSISRPSHDEIITLWDRLLVVCRQFHEANHKDWDTQPRFMSKVRQCVDTLKAQPSFLLEFAAGRWPAKLLVEYLSSDSPEVQKRIQEAQQESQAMVLLPDQVPVATSPSSPSCSLSSIDDVTSLATGSQSDSDFAAYSIRPTGFIYSDDGDSATDEAASNSSVDL